MQVLFEVLYYNKSKIECVYNNATVVIPKYNHELITLDLPFIYRYEDVAVITEDQSLYIKKELLKQLDDVEHIEFFAPV